MAIDTTCPFCATAYHLADHLEGKSVRCKKCNSVFTVGGTARAAVTTEARPARQERFADVESYDEDDRRHDDRDFEDRPGRRSRRPQGGIPGWALALLIVLFVLLIAGIAAVAVWALLGNAGSQGPAPFAPNQDAVFPAQQRETDFNKIRIGMTEDEILRMYGEPMRKEDLDKIWFWHNGLTEDELKRPDGSLKPVRLYRYAVFGKGFETVIFVEGRVYKRNGRPK
jgi:predicted Zn finger-like uncharacterized protein